MGTAGVVLELDTTDNYFATIEERHIFSPTVVNLARFSFMRPTETEVQDSPQIPSLVFTPSEPNGRVAIGAGPAGTTVGISSMLPNWLIPTHFVEGDDIIWTRGAHSIRMGIGLERVDDNETSPASLGGTYTFASVLTFLEATPSTVTIPIRKSRRDARSTYLDADSLHSGRMESEQESNTQPRVTLRVNSNPTEQNNLLHNVTQFTPSGELAGTGFNPVSTVFQSNPTNKNFAPRIGVAYSPFADHKTSIRADSACSTNCCRRRTCCPAIGTSLLSCSARGPIPASPIRL